MKVVHNKLQEGSEEEQARYFQQDGQLDKAVKIYEKLLKSDPLNELLYKRLMIIYRKQKNYKKELAIIRSGIREFEKLYQPPAHLSGNKKIASLSRALLRSTGLSDLKGKPLYQKEPIGSWNRRKLIVEKLLDKQTGKNLK